MQVVTDTLRNSFRRGVDVEAHKRLQWQHREQQERERRQKQNEVDQGESDFIDLAAVIITNEQAELFRSEIDTYQLVTVEALEENRKAIELVRERLERFMDQAHRLDYGRRVFKTEDGLRVFDEFGAELPTDIIDPDEIPDHLPRWEVVKDALDELERLEADQTELLEFQADLDEAQDLLDSGAMTQEQFDSLRERLASDAPETVKSRVDGMKPTSEASASSPALNTDIDLDAELAAMPLAKPLAPGGTG